MHLDTFSMLYTMPIPYIASKTLGGLLFVFIMLITAEEMLSVNLRIEKCDNHIPFAEGK